MIDKNKDIVNRERDRINFMVKRDGVNASLDWAERTKATYSTLLSVLEWRWNQQEFTGSIMALGEFIRRDGILDKRRHFEDK